MSSIGTHYIIKDTFDNGKISLQLYSKDAAAWSIGKGGLNNSYTLIMNFWGAGRGEIYSNYISLPSEWIISFYLRVIPSSIEVTGSSYPLYLYLESPNGTIIIKYIGGYSSDGENFIFKTQAIIGSKTLTVTYDGPQSNYASNKWIHIVIINNKNLTIKIYKVLNQTNNKQQLLGNISSKKLDTQSLRIRAAKSWNFQGKLYLDNLEIIENNDEGIIKNVIINHKIQTLGIGAIITLLTLTLITIKHGRGRPRRK